MHLKDISDVLNIDIKHSIVNRDNDKSNIASYMLRNESFMFGKTSWFSQNFSENINKYFENLKKILSTLNYDINNQLQSKLLASSLKQWVSLCIELDVYDLLKSANLRPHFLYSNQNNVKVPDFSIQLSDGVKMIVECTVLHENYSDPKSEQVIKTIQFIHQIFTDNHELIQNDFEIDNITGGNKFGNSDKNKIIQFLKKFQLDSQKFEDFYKSKNISFLAKKFVKEFPNRMTVKFPDLPYKEPEKQLNNALKKKSKQFASSEKPNVVVIGQWGEGWWFNKRFGRDINDLNIGRISSKISAVVILPGDFFPFHQVILDLRRNKVNKQSPILSTFTFFDKKDGKIEWNKEGRYLYLLRNPRATHHIPESFEKQLAQVIEVITLDVSEFRV